MKKRSLRNKEKDPGLKKLKQIKNLLMFSLLKSGATSEEVNYATGMGSSNIRGMFPIKKKKS
ncbi:hypothetical protein MYX04_06445 [Nitrospiraceae bacterium AH_259_D15_M11_P09]|nr:hypothetical protein [Nitrospiraceae bacterium AH_259_D15_M11_P09]